MFIDDALLDWVQRAVGARQPFDGKNSSVTDCVCQHRARIVRHAVDKNSAGAAFGSVASQFRSGESQFVAQRPRQRLLLHDIDATLLTVDIESKQPFAPTCSQLLTM